MKRRELETELNIHVLSQLNHSPLHQTQGEAMQEVKKVISAACQEHNPLDSLEYSISLKLYSLKEETAKTQGCLDRLTQAYLSDASDVTSRDLEETAQQIAMIRTREDVWQAAKDALARYRSSQAA